ncbi:nuclear transport factor 2 family protein [Microbacterium paludicola]|uniref:Nuclear transport factor 2 family protein n=2 Tax=Microbacterium paludicola TaxID=300019 RepID=A0A4Y9FZE1_9MICO|nr:nuclear transport factor 2 family protein [Microbacterium paludicola]MBF0815217.1 nuclear transport factor 2 family protein [Microbacterium paludicola]TFU34094.1 nuclear transport factor 2 family protein [Microbacterium paludicola]
MRSTTEVLHDHLMKRLQGDVEGDLSNYSQDVVMLTGSGEFRGHEGVMQCAGELDRIVGDAEFAYDTTMVSGEYGFLQWSASSGDAAVCDGADSFVVRDGLIVMQTVHYTPR